MPRSPNSSANSTHSRRSLDELEFSIGYQFRDQKLLQKALTHSSADESSYEVLEFLGDSVLSLAVSSLLIEHSDQSKEGDLTKRRSAVVNNRHALQSISNQLKLIDYAILGSSFPTSNESALNHLRSNLIESLIGAIYLDGGFDCALTFVASQFRNLLDNVSQNNLQDSKSKLQELAQAQGMSLPTYTVVKVIGSDHEPVFTVECEFEGLKTPIRGKGKSIKQAEQNAASGAYEFLTAAENE